MQIDFARTAWQDAAADWLVVGLAENEAPAGPLAALDEALGGRIARLREREDFTGKAGDRLALYDVAGIAAKRLLLVGLGQRDKLDAESFRKAMQSAARKLSEKKDVSVAVALPPVAVEAISARRALELAALAFVVGCVGQDRYRAEPGRHPFRSIALLAVDGEGDAGRGDSERGRILGEAINLTRELVDAPPREIFPESFAARAEEVARAHGLACEVFDRARLEDERMQALLAVAQGSAQPPRMVVLEYKGAGEGAPVLALVGKGVTFDSGGLSLKSAENMQTMKCDMAGAATVLGAMTAIARLGLPVNVTGYMGLVENLPGGNAFKVGDVLTARNGVTIEVLNTDAEGRLMLADVLSYAVDQGAERIIDLATLTGACVVALGEDVVGAFANDQVWCDRVLAAARAAGERVWQLPMFELYEELIKSDVADIKNIGGRWGGAITAAKFLERFVGTKPWVHLDIAGPSFASSNKPHREGGGTGCMVATLVEVAERYGEGNG
ncbi:MAG: leucyl aminopeptidase [Planctomycetales bacterium]